MFYNIVLWHKTEKHAYLCIEVLIGIIFFLKRSMKAKFSQEEDYTSAKSYMTSI